MAYRPPWVVKGTLAAGHVQAFRASGVVLPPKQLQEHLAAHPSVAESELIDGIAYVVMASDVPVDDWELEEYLMVKSGLTSAAVPRVRFVDQLQGPSRSGVPFTQVHILDALFRELDADGSGQISFEEFVRFCHSRNLFSDTRAESHDVFFRARSTPSASEILFGGDSLFHFRDFQPGTIKFYEFQKLVLDAGLVETTLHPEEDYHLPLVTYFLDERIADVALRRWFRTFDLNGDGCLEYGEYAKLVADYRLPFAVSEQAYHQLARSSTGCSGDAGLSLDDFRALMEEAGALKTGASVGKDDEVGQAWRLIEDTQQFLSQRRVFVADGRVGTSPPQGSGTLRFVCISDTHGHHREMTSRLPPGDVLLHAGDFSMAGGLEEVMDFVAWLQSLPFSRKVFIAGNHDLSFDRAYSGQHGKEHADASEVRAAFAKACGDDGTMVYLEDEQCRIEGVSIYGSPWQPEFGYWAFNLPRGYALAEKWHAVPTGVDVLLVHGPPLGRGDTCLPSLKHTGCADLLSEIQGRIRPAFCVYGHVHEGAGVTFDGTTHFLNACSLNEHYEFVHAPLVFDVPVPDSPSCE